MQSGGDFPDASQVIPVSSNGRIRPSSPPFPGKVCSTLEGEEHDLGVSETWVQVLALLLPAG